MKKLSTFLLIVMILVVGCAGSPQPVQSTDMVANADPYEIGVAGASFSGFTGIGMSAGTFTVSFAPRTNEVILVTKNQGNETHLYLDKSDRDLLISAITSYLESFEQRTLNRNNDMLSTYGTFPAFMNWGMLTLNAEATATVSTGYEFKKDAPYFTLTIPETDNDRYTSTTRKSTIKKSGYFQIFFTRSQLAEFGEMLIQEYLESTLEEQNISRASSDPDTY
ncbi:MAG: hypothetical protein GX290_04450 [Treponema sp.]|nr:hypothetical protein [Treponema sp.]